MLTVNIHLQNKSINCLNFVHILKLNKMKSKKKLIYKLQENINQNPFKQIDQVSFRNVGIRSYDFNKLKSIRAISQRSLPSNQIHHQKNPPHAEPNHDLKLNSLSMKERFQQKAQQIIICNKKKLTVDKSLISMQPKMLNLRTILKQKHLEAHQEKGQNPVTINSTDYFQCNSDQATNHQNEKNKPTGQLKCNFGDQMSLQLNSHKHSRNVSLPAINTHNEEPKNSNVLSPHKKLDMLVEQQRAKQQILKQVRVKAQEKINKQVLMSIKLKSIQNLERIARSQSEVIKIDKWKEKYTQLKNSHEIELRQKNSPKNLVSQLSQQRYQENSQNCLNQRKPSDRYMHEQPQTELQKSDIQQAKDSLYNITVSEGFRKQQDPIFSYKDTLLHGKSSKFVHEDMDNKMGLLEQNYHSQMLKTNQIDCGDFWDGQHLKITVSRTKGKKYRQNQNLSNSPTQYDKPQRQQTKKNIDSNHKNALSKTQAQLKQRQLQLQTGNNFQGLNSLKQQNPVSPTQFWTKSKLYTGEQKGEIKRDLFYSASSSIGLSLKRNLEIKCKINEQDHILNKVVEDGMPEQWQLKRLGDEDLTDFDFFVQNQGKQADQA